MSVHHIEHPHFLVEFRAEFSFHRLFQCLQFLFEPLKYTDATDMKKELSSNIILTSGIANYRRSLLFCLCSGCRKPIFFKEFAVHAAKLMEYAHVVYRENKAMFLF